MLRTRQSGILLHISSLPTEYGIGDFGPVAYKFTEFLKKAGQTYWQILPLNYTTAGGGFSPYNCFSAFAGNPLLISPRLLCQDSLLSRSDIDNGPAFPKDRVNYKKVLSYKSKLLETAFESFNKCKKPADYTSFLNENESWLEDFATFIALKQHFKGRVWCNWPAGIRDRKKGALRDAKRQLKLQIDKERFIQYVFYKQYFKLKRQCNQKEVQIFGDLPIYVAYDSADVWACPEIFKLSANKKPEYVSGVPPDYFSRSGQLWGNPVYDWEYLRNNNYEWWIRRLEHNLKLFDLVRIDHFRGFMAYWQVRAGSRSAREGRWVPAPAEDFFTTLFNRIPFAPIVAEDLGDITPDVREIINRLNFPSMKVLQFAFGDKPRYNPHVPHNHTKNAVVYTGTHDNNTTRGWFEKELSKNQKKLLSTYLGRTPSTKTIHWDMIRLAMGSVANLAIIPMQDVLGLPGGARMNHPSTKKGNWRYLNSKFPGGRIVRKLKSLTKTYGRA